MGGWFETRGVEKSKTAEQKRNSGLKNNGITPRRVDETLAGKRQGG